MRAFVLTAVCLLPTAAFAQQPGGRITGSVLCGDTNAPARFAKVMLKPATFDLSSADEQIKTMTSRAPKPPPQSQLDSMRKSMARNIYNNQERSSTSTVDVNGHYTVTGIAPGVYFVHVEMPGYVDQMDQFSFDDITSSNPEVRARIVQSAPMVTIIGSEEQRIDLHLERGASISGRVFYDDGSPAAGWTVNTIRKSALAKKSGSSSVGLMPSMPSTIIGEGVMFVADSSRTTFARTDDLGTFRISGLSPGEYLLRAELVTAQPGRSAALGVGLHMMVYSGNKTTANEAKTFGLTVGQNLSGEDLTVPLRALHSIRGVVTAKSDGHNVNSGRVSVSSEDDAAMSGSAEVNPDGSFEVPALPPGKYRVSANGAADVRITGTRSTMGMTQNTTQTLRRYGTGTADVTLNDADATGLNLSVPDSDASVANQPVQSLPITVPIVLGGMSP